MPESVGPLCAAEGGEQENDGANWPAGAGGKNVGKWGAGLNTYLQNSLPGLLKPFAHGWLTAEASPPRKEKKERTEMGAGGARAQQEALSKDIEGEREGTEVPPERATCSSGTCDFVD